MRVGIGKGRALGFLFQSQMLELAFAALEAIRNLAQRAGLRQLAEEHRHKLLPTGEAFGPMLGLEIAHMTREIRPLKKAKDLAKQTSGSNHCDLR